MAAADESDLSRGHRLNAPRWLCGLIGRGEALARLIAFYQDVRAFPVMRSPGVLEAFFTAGVTHLSAKGAVFGRKLGALREESRGEKAHVSAGTCERDQRCHRPPIFGAQAGRSTAFARCRTGRAGRDALFKDGL